eukprot:2731712-Rhodomonas_salina.1
MRGGRWEWGKEEEGSGTGVGRRESVAERRNSAGKKRAGRAAHSSTDAQLWMFWNGMLCPKTRSDRLGAIGMLHPRRHWKSVS